MAEDAESDSSEEPARGPLVGRRIARALYYLLAVSVAAIATVQITQQVFFPREPEGKKAFSTCEEGIVALYGAIQRGRRAALRPPDGADEDPDQALERYREAVRPTWAHLSTVRQSCGDRHGSLLDALERLRYSEEHGVRHQAVDLTALRRRVRILIHESLSERPAEAQAIPTHRP